MRTALISMIAIGLSSGSLAAEDWTRFRGPNGSGVGTASDLPIELTVDTASWVSPVLLGRSSPIVVDDLVVVTGAEGDELVTLSLDVENGEVRWRSAVPRLRRDELSAYTGSVVATPVSDGRHVYAFFPEFGIVAYDLEGEERWRHELPPFESFYGMASSPVVEAGVLVLQLDQQRGPYIVGIDTGSGELLWRKEREIGGESWTTPVVHHSGSDSAAVVTFGTYFVDAYQPRTGERLWRTGEVGYLPVSSPVLDGDRLYLSVPNMQGEYSMPSEGSMFANDADGDDRLTSKEIEGKPWGSDHGWLDNDGDGFVTKEEYRNLYEGMNSNKFGLMAIDLVAPSGPKIVWRERRAIPHVTSPILHRGVLFLIKDGGILTSFDPNTGEVLKRGRIEGAVDQFFPSPVANDGRLYFSSSSGKIAVVSAEAEWKTLAVNDLDEQIFASPAIANGRLFIRTRGKLYAFESTKE